MNCVMSSNIYGVMNMITNGLISDDNGRYEAVSCNILNGFYMADNTRPWILLFLT